MATLTASAEPRARYDTDGFTVYRDVLPRDLVTEAADHVLWLMEQNPDLRPEQLSNHLMADDPFWLRLISDDRLLDVAEQFIGPDIALFASHYIAKAPFQGQKVLWHQDGSYWPLEPMEVVTLWLAADDTDAENGCLRIVPGTQNDRLLSWEELEKSTDGADVLGSGMSPDDVDEGAAVDIVMSAGDVEVHHPNVIHGSNANTSPRWRRGLTIRYIPASTRIVTDGTWISAYMLRGKPTPGANRYMPFPTYRDDGTQMPFAGTEAWNAKARDLNARYASEIVPPEPAA
ncbi:MAG: phytanoyl-CoA dioxygenase family protein [Bacteroidota bacterium]